MNFKIRNVFPVLSVFCLAFYTQCVFSQKPAATIENVVIHHAKEDDEDLSSDFPIIHTGNAAADIKINTLLQTRFFGKPLDARMKLTISQNFNPTGDQVFGYDTQISDRVVGIVIKQHRLNNAMSLNGYDQTFPFLFDPRSGQQFSPLVLFSTEGVLRFLGKAFPGLRQSYNETMDRYVEGFSKLKIPAQREQCECDCEGMLQDVFRKSLVTFRFSSEGVTLTMDGCNWQNPGPHDVYSFTIPIDDVRPWLSDYGRYMIDGGTVVNLPAQHILFQATVGSNIYATMVLRTDGNQLTGYEIYNRVGSIINLRGTVNGTQYTFDELSPEGVSIATFKATRNGAAMNGTWIKGDKSRTLPFSAMQYE